MQIMCEFKSGRAHAIESSGETYEDFKSACNMLKDVVFPEIYKEDILLAKTLSEALCQKSD